MATGISVSPALVRLDLSQGPPQFNLTYTNNSDQALNISLSAKDFTSLEEGWRLNFLDPSDTITYRYSLSSWLKFSHPDFLLLPQQSRDVRVTIRKDDLSIGGHYASIIAEFSPPSPASASAVTIKSQLVSLVFVRTNTGTEREEANISSFSPISSNYFEIPQKYLLRLNNSGNTELIPRGILVVRNLRNQEVARGILNQEGAIILPESIRRYEIPITVKQPVYLLPGPYQATLTVNYGSNSLSASTQFLNFGHPLNLLILLIAVSLFLLSLRRLLNKMKRR